ncbi:TPA: hypothetical protein QDE31_37055 [Burkholderia cenocepacia]|nr:hypothetical protein [Burkholderia cenocepacia]HDR9875317.1 hypothetical protein [Burkholderia cenocepacia]
MVGLGLRESFSLGSSIAISKVLRVLDNKVLKVTLLSIDSANCRLSLLLFSPVPSGVCHPMSSLLNCLFIAVLALDRALHRY